VKSYGFGAAIGFILGVIAVFWVRPDTSAGPVFIVFTVTLLCFVVGAVANFIVGLFRK
jgi:hypothetical protein